MPRRNSQSCDDRTGREAITASKTLVMEYNRPVCCEPTRKVRSNLDSDLKPPPKVRIIKPDTTATRDGADIRSKVIPPLSTTHSHDLLHTYTCR